MSEITSKWVNDQPLMTNCSHGIKVVYNPVKKNIYLYEYDSRLKMSIPYKEFNSTIDLREYAEGFIDMLLRMGGKE